MANLALFQFYGLCLKGFGSKNGPLLERRKSCSYEAEGIESASEGMSSPSVGRLYAAGAPLVCLHLNVSTGHAWTDRYAEGQADTRHELAKSYWGRERDHATW